MSSKKSEPEVVNDAAPEVTPAQAEGATPQPSPELVQLLVKTAAEIFVHAKQYLLATAFDPDVIAMKCFSLALPFAMLGERVRIEGTGIIASARPEQPQLVDITLEDPETKKRFTVQMTEDLDGYCRNAPFSDPANQRSRKCREVLAAAKAAGSPIPADALVRDYIQ